MKKILVEIEDENGLYFTIDAYGNRVSVGSAMFVDVSTEQTREKVKILKNLAESGFAPKEIIELKEKGLL